MASNVCAAFRGRTSSDPAIPKASVNRASARRSAVVTRAGFLDFLTAPPKVAARGRANDLVDRLLELSDGTEGGIRASSATREAVGEVVDELEAFCPKAPLRSELIFGEWEVVFASKPETAGGPFRSPIGRVVFPGQRAIQTIAPPNICINEVSYKALGFVPGAARQNGEIEPLDESTFQLTFPDLDGKRAGGPPRRVIQTVYLDDRIRIARALPQEESQQASFYVFQRVGGVDEEEEEEEEVTTAPVRSRQPARGRGRQTQVAEPEAAAAEAAPSRPKFALPGTQMFSKKPGMATRAERSYEERTGGRVQSKAANRTASPASRGGGTQVRKSREEIVAERAALKAAQEEERRRAREAAAAAKAAQEEERRRAREAVEAERAALAGKRAAAREQFESLFAEASEAASEAREAAAAAKAAERESTALLRSASQARDVIARAVGSAERAMAELSEIREAKNEAEGQVKEARGVVEMLEKQLKQREAALAPRVGRK